MDNLVIAKYQDGRMLKGRTLDIGPNKNEFHLTTLEGEQKWVNLRELKSVFFVKALEGGSARNRAGTTDRPKHGRKITIEFEDGEQLVGTSFDHRITKDFFFVFPVDENDNNERILINRGATRRILLEKIESDAEAAARIALETKIYRGMYEAAVETDRAGLGIEKTQIVAIGNALRNNLGPAVAQYPKSAIDF